MTTLNLYLRSGGKAFLTDVDPQVAAQAVYDWATGTAPHINLHASNGEVHRYMAGEIREIGVER